MMRAAGGGHCVLLWGAVWGVAFGSNCTAPSCVREEQQLLIVHVHHTGSHALCQALGRMACAVVDCSERYEKNMSFSELFFDDASRVRKRLAATLVRATEAWR